MHTQQVSSRELLTGVIPPPEAAGVLYQALRLREHRVVDGTAEGDAQSADGAVAAGNDEKPAAPATTAAPAAPAAGRAGPAPTAPRPTPAR